MAINTLATATIFQTTLDQIAVQEAKTGWMDANSGQVVYNGGAEVKVPKINSSAARPPVYVTILLNASSFVTKLDSPSSTCMV